MRRSSSPRRGHRARSTAAAFLGIALAWAPAPRAADFDLRGIAALDPRATASESFESLVLNEEQALNAELVTGPTDEGERALHGASWVRVDGSNGAFEVDLALPATDAAYRFRAWVRHARVSARAIFEYSTGRDVEVGYMFPSGRVTSDGWVELESNPVSVTGSEIERAFFRLEGAAVDLDAIEATPEPGYDPGGTCGHAFDDECGPEAVCMSGACRQGDRFVPPLPAPEVRDSIADYLANRLALLSGGHYTRTRNLPAALAEAARMKSATTAWQYWSRFALAVRLMRDWHTSTDSAIEIHRSEHHLSACFIEGDADLTRAIVPSTTGRPDVLVSHVIEEGALGLAPGDRLVSVDDRHPIEWGRSLIGVNWSHREADDPDVDAEIVESLPGLIATFAERFSVLHCDAATETCDGETTDYLATDIPVGLQSIAAFGPRCDFRPIYHQANPPATRRGDVTDHHFLSSRNPWIDELIDSQPGEELWGMTWDSLVGGGFGITDTLRAANDTFRANARGVVLDHRTGNGGTIDAPAAVTELVRGTADLSVGPGFMAVAGYDGPFDAVEGRELYARYSRFGNLIFRVGSDTPAEDLPVALLIHRDGSASDWLAHGMKGAPNVRIFGPHETAGAFSSFYDYSYWSRFGFTVASGDTITADGEALIGTGIAPDVVVGHTQSALLAGRDAPYEAALEWVRSQLQ